MTLRSISKLAFWSCLGLITLLSLLPPPQLPPVDIWDKASHAIAYAALMLTGGIGYRLQVPILQIALLLFGFGVTIEIAQYLMPGRSFSLYDMLANAAGIVAMLLVVLPLERLLRIQYP